MKSFVKLMMLVVAAAMTAPFFISGRDGKPLLTLDRLRAPHGRAPQVTSPGFGGADDSATENEDEAGEGTLAQPLEIFKWHDENGVWHFSDTKEQGQAAQTVTVDPNASIVHLPPIKNSERYEQITAATASGSRGTSANSTDPDSSPFGKITNLIDDSKKLDQLQQDRMAREERAAQE